MSALNCNSSQKLLVSIKYLVIAWHPMKILQLCQNNFFVETRFLFLHIMQHLECIHAVCHQNATALTCLAKLATEKILCQFFKAKSPSLSTYTCSSSCSHIIGSQIPEKLLLSLSRIPIPKLKTTIKGHTFIPQLLFSQKASLWYPSNLLPFICWFSSVLSPS